MAEFGDELLIKQKQGAERNAVAAVRHLIDVYGIDFVVGIIDKEKEDRGYVAFRNVTEKSVVRGSCE